MQPATLRQLIHLGYGLIASCPRCRRWQPLPVAKLAAKHGVDMPLLALKEKLRCSKCGGGNCQIQIESVKWK